jgi:cation/acetate symporter
MDLQTWTYNCWVTFALYIGIAIWSRATRLKNFMLQVENFSLANGMATAADWMSAASLYLWPESSPLMDMTVLFI